MEITAKQFEELMALARDNRTLLIQQDKKLDKMQTTLVGNGHPGSVVARLLLVEERQKEAATERKRMEAELIKQGVCMERMDKEGTNASHRITQLERKQDETLAEVTIVGSKVDAVTEIVNNWKQRGIGFSVGMAAVAGGSFAAVLKFLETIIS